MQALDLAGKIIKDLDVQQGWAGVPMLMRRELRGSADAEDVLEYRVIAASLAAVPLRDRDAAKRVFSVFALVAVSTPTSVRHTCWFALAAAHRSLSRLRHCSCRRTPSFRWRPSRCCWPQ